MRSGEGRGEQVTRSKGAPARRADASMTLLTDLLERPLDPAYGAVAARRVDAGLPATKGLHSVLFTVTLLVVGLVLTVSARTLTDNATARSSARAELVRQIEAAREVRDGRAATVSTLTREVAARDAQVLASQSSAEAGELRQLSAATGATSVVGPGMVVTLDDAPTANAPGANADPRGGGRVQDGVVRSRDLQIIVNSLWAAGAEAMMINGQRLTSTSAIRFAGQAILVNYRPLVRPYVITAIGDPKTLPARFAQGAGGTYAATLTGTFGIPVGTDTGDRFVLPSSTSAQTRVAVPLAPAGPATMPAPSPSTSGGSS